MEHRENLERKEPRAELFPAETDFRDLKENEAETGTQAEMSANINCFLNYKVYTVILFGT